MMPICLVVLAVPILKNDGEIVNGKDYSMNLEKIKHV
jgi:hypothetical protein